MDQARIGWNRLEMFKMAGKASKQLKLTGKGSKWLKLAGNSSNCWKIEEIAGNSWNVFKLLEMARMADVGEKWVDIAVNGFKWPEWL